MQPRSLDDASDELDPADAEGLGTLWSRVAAILESHAAAEVKYFYRPVE